MSVITRRFDGLHLAFERGFVGDVRAQFAQEHAELDFSHVEPASMLGRVMKDQAPGNAVSFGGFKGFIERGQLVDVEIIHDHLDALGIGIADIHQPAHLVSKVLSGAVLGDFDVSPVGQRLKEQEQVARPVALIFIVHAPHLTGQGWKAGLFNQLLAAFIHAHFRTLGITGLLIHIQDMFHRRYKLGAGARQTPHLLLPGLHLIFWSVWRTASCEMLSTNPNSTKRSASRRSAQWSSGGSLQVSAIRYASPRPSSFRLAPGRGSSLRAFCNPPSTKRCRVRSTVLTLVSRAATIRSSVQPSSAFSKIRARVTLRVETLPFRVSSTSCARSSSVMSTTYSFLATGASCCGNGPSLHLPTTFTMTDYYSCGNNSPPVRIMQPSPSVFRGSRVQAGHYPSTGLASWPLLAFLWVPFLQPGML